MDGEHEVEPKEDRGAKAPSGGVWSGRDTHAGGDVVGGNKSESHTHYHGAREPWRLTEIKRDELKRNERVFVEDVFPKGALEVASVEPLTLVRGRRRSGRYATALCYARRLAEARHAADAASRGTGAQTLRTWHLDDLDCGLDMALQQVCRDNPGDVVIVRDADDGPTVGSRHSQRDVTSTLQRIRDGAQAHGSSVILTVADDLEGAKVIAVPERLDLDKLMQIVGSHGREAVKQRRLDTAHEQRLGRAATRFRDWLGQVALKGKAVAPGRIAAVWDQFGTELLDEDALDADTEARLVGILSGEQAQLGWFTAQPFPDRVAMVLVWLFGDLEAAALMESTMAVLAHAARALHEDVLAGPGTVGTSVRDAARRLVAPTHAAPVRSKAGRFELLDPALGEVIRERAADYAFLLAPLARALSETLFTRRQAAPAWRKAFGRALGRIGVHRLDEFAQHVQTLWEEDGPRQRRIELREALCEACRGGPAAARRVAALLKDSGRLDSEDGAMLALAVLPALVNAHVATRRDSDAGNESSDATAALDLARHVARASRSLSKGTDVKRALRRVLAGVARNAPAAVELALREALQSVGDADFSQLLAEAVGDALPALLPRRGREVSALLADLLRCSNANRFARAALHRALPALTEHARPDERDKADRVTGPFPSWQVYADLFHGLAWHTDSGVVRGLRSCLCRVRERIERGVGLAMSPDVQQRLAALAREADAALGLIVRCCSARVVIAGRFHGKKATVWRARLQAWLAPYAQVVVADTSDLDRLRAALAPVAGQPPCALVYLAPEPDGDTDVLTLSPAVLAIGPEAPTGAKRVECVRLALDAPTDARLFAFSIVLEWWSRHVDRLVDAGDLAEDMSPRLSEVARLADASDGPRMRVLVERLASETPEDRALARAALLRRVWRAAPPAGATPPAGTPDAVAAQWRSVREALAELPQRRWDDLWLAAVHADAPLHYVRPHGERKAAILVKLAHADGSGDTGARPSLRRARAQQVYQIFERLQRELASEFEVQTREEPPRRLASRSLERLLEPIRASECELMVLLGGRTSFGESLIDLQDWRARLGPRLVVVDLDASLARQRAQSTPRTRISRQQQADEAASAVVEILGQVDRQRRPMRRVDTERPVAGGA